MKITIFDIISSEYAVNYEDGKFLFEAIKALKNKSFTISFVGITRVSTLFLNESIGKFILQNPKSADSIDFIYPLEKPLVKKKVEDVIENALMGEEYDKLINAAKIAL